jgi:pimeloyl-ACP methyl ester carboxylesterase
VTALGQRLRRREDARLLTGEGCFLDDIPSPPGCLHAVFIRSPHAHARILGIDTAAALALPGVVAVLTGEALARHVAPLRMAPPIEGLEPMEMPVLPSETARFVGDPVAMLLAENPALAADAAELVEVAWQPLAAMASMADAAAPGAVLVDPSFADQFHAMSQGAPPAAVAAQLKGMQTQARRLRECATLAPLPDDCARLSKTMPPALAAFRKEQESRPSFLLTNASEFESFIPGADGRSLDQKELEAAPTNFGDKPLVILTAGKSLGDPSMPPEISAGIDRAWKGGHDSLATLSTRGSNTVVPDAGHNIQHDQPQAVIDAVLKTVATLRGR